MKGVEPSSPDWKSGVMSFPTVIRHPRVLHPGGMVLMLSHFERVPGIEPRSQAWKARVITVIRYPHFLLAKWDSNPRLILSQVTATGIVCIRHHCYSPI